MREPQFQEQIALYKRRENLDLISAWAPREARSVLKTDLFEEGFGKDSLLDALAGTYPMTVGMDISDVVAAAANGRLPGVRYVVSDACALPFKTQSFDLIVSISTLDHLPPELLAGALGELCRVLRPAGCLILTLDSRHNPLHVLSNHIRRWMGRIHAERCYTVNEVRAALARQPVVVTETTAIYHVPFPVNFLAKKARRMVGARADVCIRGLVRLCQGLAALPTRFFTGRYIALRIVKAATPALNGGRLGASRQKQVIRSLWFKGLSRARIHRRLVLIERTLSEPLPEMSATVPVCVGILTDGEIGAYMGFHPDQHAGEIRRRLQGGQWCFAVWHERRIIHASWAAPGRARIEYLSTEITLAPEELYVYEVFTTPAFRGQGAAPVCILEMARYFRAGGYRRLLAAVSPDNRSGFRPWEKLGHRRIGVIGFTGLGPWRRAFCRIELGGSPPGGTGVAP